MKKLTTCAALFLAATLGMNAQKPMKAPKGGKAISDELIRGRCCVLVTRWV